MGVHPLFLKYAHPKTRYARQEGREIRRLYPDPYRRTSQGFPKAHSTLTSHSSCTALGEKSVLSFSLYQTWFRVQQTGLIFISRMTEMHPASISACHSLTSLRFSLGSDKKTALNLNQVQTCTYTNGSRESTASCSGALLHRAKATVVPRRETGGKHSKVARSPSMAIIVSTLRPVPHRSRCHCCCCANPHALDCSQLGILERQKCRRKAPEGDGESLK